MGYNDDYFHPEEVDEQIDQHLKESWPTIPQALQALHKDDAHRLEQIRERLEHYAQYGKNSRRPVDIQSYQQRKLQNGQYDPAPPPQSQQHPATGRRLGLLLTELVAALIIISVLIFPVLFTHQSHYTVTLRDLFLSNDQGVMRVDAITKQVYWQYRIPDYGLGNPISPMVANDIVYAESQDSVYAIDAGTGTLRWSYKLPSQISPFLSSKARLVLSGDHVYVPDVSMDVYQFNAIAGTKEHVYHLHLNTTVVAIAVENNVLYANALNDMCAISLTDGKQLWYKLTNLALGIPHVLHGAIYIISSSDPYWPVAQPNSVSYINAFSADTGTVLWPAAQIQGTVTDISLSNNTIYAGATDGSISAYAMQTGRQLWSKLIAGVSFSDTAPQIDAGIVYLGTRNPTVYNPPPMGIIALDATTGRIRWQYPHSLQEMTGAGHVFGPPLVVQSVVYVNDTNRFQTASQLYAIANGTVLWHIQIRSS